MNNADTIRLVRRGEPLDGLSIMAPGRLIPACAWCDSPAVGRENYCVEHLKDIHSPMGLERR